MGSLEALTMLNTVMGAVINSMIAMQQVSAIIMNMKAEGRETFTPEEQAVILAMRDDAMKALEEALK